MMDDCRSDGKEQQEIPAKYSPSGFSFFVASAPIAEKSSRVLVNLEFFATVISTEASGEHAMPSDPMTITTMGVANHVRGFRA
jgi:hypothetical protein